MAPPTAPTLPVFVREVTGSNLEMTSTTVVKANRDLCTSLRHMAVSGPLPVPTALTPRKASPVPFEEEDR